LDDLQSGTPKLGSVRIGDHPRAARKLSDFTVADNTTEIAMYPQRAPDLAQFAISMMLSIQFSNHY